jgi:cytoskeletal protein RodZ
MPKEKNQNQVVAQSGDLRALLLQYRDNAGFSAEQMASALCLSDSVIKNLENEEFQLLAEPPYVRGYIRNYAKQANVDSTEAVRVYETLRGANPDALDYHIKVSPSMHNEKKGISPIFSQLALLALLFAGLFGLFMIPAVNQWISTVLDGFSKQTTESQNNITDKPSLIGTMPVPIPLNNQAAPNPQDIKRIENDIKQVKTNAKTATSNLKKTETSDNKSAKKESTKPTSEPDTVEQATPKESDTKNINIKMVFTKEVWMRIKNKSNKTVYEGQTKAGQERSLSLEKPLTFRVGNAQGLSLFVNGKAVDISQYIKGSIANFTLK